MAPKQSRQVIKYNFYRVSPEWRRLPDAQREASKEEFAAVVEESAAHMRISSYSLAGLRADVDFMLWVIARSLEEHQEFAATVNRTKLVAYVETPYSYLALARRSEYFDGHRKRGQDGTQLTIRPGAAPYLVIYPFVKTKAWYALPQEERQRIMNVHFEVGHKYPNVRINTSYSFGLDDQEFVLAFETDSPSDFVDLVMDLRGTEATSYTLRDTPIFTAIARPIRECLDVLG